MASMIDDLMGHLDKTGGIDEMAGSLGVSGEHVVSMLGTALPAILGGLASNASTPKGAESLRAAVSTKHDGSILDAAGGLLGNIDLADGAKILGHVFGGKQEVVTETLAVKSDASPGLMDNLMSMVAPMVMGWIGKQVLGGKLDADALGGLLGKQKKEAVKKDSGLGDLLGSAGGLGGLLGGLLGVEEEKPTKSKKSGKSTKRSKASGSGDGGLLGTLGKLLGGKK